MAVGMVGMVRDFQVGVGEEDTTGVQPQFQNSQREGSPPQEEGVVAVEVEEEVEGTGILALAQVQNLQRRDSPPEEDEAGELVGEWKAEEVEVEVEVEEVAQEEHSSRDRPILQGQSGPKVVKKSGSTWEVRDRIGDSKLVVVVGLREVRAFRAGVVGEEVFPIGIQIQAQVQNLMRGGVTPTPSGAVVAGGWVQGLGEEEGLKIQQTRVQNIQRGLPPLGVVAEERTGEAEEEVEAEEVAQEEHSSPEIPILQAPRELKAKESGREERLFQGRVGIVRERIELQPLFQNTQRRDLPPEAEGIGIQAQGQDMERRGLTPLGEEAEE